MDLPFRRPAALTPTGVVVLAASTAALLIAGLILLVRFAPNDEPAHGGAPATSKQLTSMPQPPVWGAPSPAKQGETWSHKELFAYLNSRGMAWAFHETAQGENHGPAAYAKERPSAEDQSNLDNDHYEILSHSDCLYVQKRASAGAAKDEAGTKHDALSWGRFLFVGPTDSLRRISSALGVAGQ